MVKHFLFIFLLFQALVLSQAKAQNGDAGGVTQDERNQLAALVVKLLADSGPGGSFPADKATYTTDISNLQTLSQKYGSHKQIVSALTGAISDITLALQNPSTPAIWQTALADASTYVQNAAYAQWLTSAQVTTVTNIRYSLLQLLSSPAPLTSTNINALKQFSSALTTIQQNYYSDTYYPTPGGIWETLGNAITNLNQAVVNAQYPTLWQQFLKQANDNLTTALAW